MCKITRALQLLWTQVQYWKPNESIQASAKNLEILAEKAESEESAYTEKGR